VSKQKKNNMSFLEHLEELRWHIIRSIVAIILIAILAFIFRNIIFDRIILAPKTPEFFTNHVFCSFSNLVNVPALCINSKPFQIINIYMAGQFTTHIMVSLIAGIILAFPYIFFEFWSFLKPAFYKNEKKYARGAVFYSSLLFLLGVLFGYYIITPLSVNFLGSYNVSDQVLNQINLISYISTVASVTLASGIIFELPVLVYFLTKIGLLTPEFLKKYRKHSIIIILILSAIITPPDIFSQILVCFPLLVLYEIGIRISKKIIAKEKANLEKD
jgi:sec-independent protein translocase protein TatC